MIVRMWRGKVPKKLKSEYVAYLNQTGLADYGKSRVTRVSICCARIWATMLSS
jgi:hypothetical protein